MTKTWETVILAERDVAAAWGRNWELAGNPSSPQPVENFQYFLKNIWRKYFFSFFVCIHRKTTNIFFASNNFFYFESIEIISVRNVILWTWLLKQKLCLLLMLMMIKASWLRYLQLQLMIIVRIFHSIVVDSDAIVDNHCQNRLMNLEPW